MEELKPHKEVEEIFQETQNKELEKLLDLVDKFLKSEEVENNLTVLKPYYIAQYLIHKENNRAKRSDVLRIVSTPKKAKESQLPTPEGRGLNREVQRKS